jgi:TatD DNase family protein
MHLVDTHCHLDVRDFDPDREEVIQDAAAAGVTRILVPAIQAEGWSGLLRLCERFRGLYPALGLHPLYIDRHRDAHLEALERLLADVRPVAVGEIGLDFFVRGLDRDRQQVIFEAQVAMARTAGLPVLIHARKSHDQVLAILRSVRVVGGIAHAFNGSLQQAHRYLDLGFKLGFGGMITFERSRKLRALARALPLEALVLETDAPDMTVASHRGERNSPAFLPEVLAALAEARGEGPAEVAERTTATAIELFGLQGIGEGGRGGALDVVRDKGPAGPARTHDG